MLKHEASAESPCANTMLGFRVATIVHGETDRRAARPIKIRDGDGSPRQSGQTVTSPRAQIWSLRKGCLQTACELVVYEDGVEAILRCDGQQYGRRFDAWAQALTHANFTRGDFERHGWRDMTL